VDGGVVPGQFRVQRSRRCFLLGGKNKLEPCLRNEMEGVVRAPGNSNPGLNVHRSIDFFVKFQIIETQN